MTFGFFFILALTSLRENSAAGMSLLFCAVHESGHLLAMSLFGIKVSELRFYGGGISISAERLDFLSSPARAMIYLSGPLANLLTCLLTSGPARALNLFLAAFNLLPAAYLDGGRLIALILPPKITNPLSAATILALTISVAAYTAINPQVLNPSNLLTLSFLLLAMVLDK